MEGCPQSQGRGVAASRWPDTQIAIRDDSLTSRGDGVCDENGIDFVFGLAGNDVLRHLVEPLVDDVRVAPTPRGAGVCIPRSMRGVRSNIRRSRSSPSASRTRADETTIIASVAA